MIGKGFVMQVYSVAACFKDTAQMPTKAKVAADKVAHGCAVCRPTGPSIAMARIGFAGITYGLPVTRAEL